MQNVEEVECVFNEFDPINSVVERFTDVDEHPHYFIQFTNEDHAKLALAAVWDDIDVTAADLWNQPIHC